MIPPGICWSIINVSNKPRRAQNLLSGVFLAATAASSVSDGVAGQLRPTPGGAPSMPPMPFHSSAFSLGWHGFHGFSWASPSSLQVLLVDTTALPSGTGPRGHSAPPRLVHRSLPSKGHILLQPDQGKGPQIFFHVLLHLNGNI